VVDENIVIEKPEMKRILAEHGYRWENNTMVSSEVMGPFLGQKCSNGVITFESLCHVRVNVADSWGVCTQEPLVRGRKTIQPFYLGFMVLL
jgi:hypothetical protein